MDLTDILQQDVTSKGYDSLVSNQNAEKQQLANLYQELQNDRYGKVTPYEVEQQRLEVDRRLLANLYQGLQNDRYEQVTPYEVAQQRLQGLRAGVMSDPASLKSYQEGTLGQFNIQSMNARRGKELEESGINPDLLDAQSKQRKAEAEQLAQGIDEVTQMFAAGQSSNFVYNHIAQKHGQEVANYYKPIIEQGLSGVTKFRNQMLQLNPDYRRYMDQAMISAKAAQARAGGGGGSSISSDKFEMKRDADVVKNAKSLLTAKILEMQNYTMGSDEFKKARDEVANLTNNHAALSKAYEAKYNNLTTADPDVKQYNPATGKIE